VLRVTVATLLLALYRTRVEGAANVPEGGALLAGNHVSHLDPALLWCASPRPTHFVAKAELWGPAWLGWALDRLWAFPVERGTADRKMISTATSLLAEGELVGMFPEGTRGEAGSDELGEAHGGVSFIALRAGVPIVPVGIAGTEKALPKGALLPRFPRVTICFGEPVDPADFEGGRKERMEAITAELMRRIAAQRDRAREAR
jgi:1-acyl-sn-glycerol-3-phosphate acyltransferase